MFLKTAKRKKILKLITKCQREPKAWKWHKYEILAYIKHTKYDSTIAQEYKKMDKNLEDYIIGEEAIQGSERDYQTDKHLESQLAPTEKTLGKKLVHAAAAGIIAGYMTLFGVHGAKHLNPKPAIAQMSEQETDRQYKIALDELTIGDKFWKKEMYQKALPHLEKAVKFYESLPESKKDGNTGTAYIELGSVLAKRTIKAYFKEGYKYPNAISRFKRAEDLIFKGIEQYNKEAKKTPKYADWYHGEGVDGAYNVLGMINKYLGNITKAKEYYKKAIKCDPKDSSYAKDNLKHIMDNKDAFLR